MHESRSEAEIFEDLRHLCRQPGFLHAISAIKFRDFFALVDQNGSPVNRYSRSRLNNNELMLLVGLAAQAESAAVFVEIGDTAHLVASADRLLEEFHTHLEAPMRAALQTLDAVDTLPLAKEAIYYGADSAYPSQYQRFARERYRPDFEWLLGNAGLSIKPIVNIAQYIVHIVDAQLSILLASSNGQRGFPSPPDLTTAFLISKAALSKRFGAKSAAFLDLFAIPINHSNDTFTDPFAYNQLNSRPFLDVGNHIYLANEYKLFESIYESPYYWMLRDDQYRNQAAINRGEFLEATIARLARQLFGPKHVFANATVKKRNGGVEGEADVLVVYGEFILVIQAKSKRLTLEARSGVTDKLKADFQAAVQSAYNQAIKFIELILAGRECQLENNDCRSFKGLSRIFPIVVLSDHFPSLTMFTEHLIEKHNEWPPVIVDLFFLEILFEVLRHPFDSLYYLQQRARFFDKIITDSEFNLLGFHMKGKLYVSQNVTFMAVDRDFGAVVDDYLAARDAGRPLSKEFPPLEHRVDVPAITALISAMKEGPPEIAGAALELLDFSKETLQGIADNIAVLQAEVRAGKPFKALSIETSHGGLSYVALGTLDQRTVAIAEAIARKHKYARKKDRWYLILDHVHSERLADRIAVVLQEWEESDEMDRFLEDVGPHFKQTYVSFKPPGAEEKATGE